MKTFHTPEQRTSRTTYRLTAGLNTLGSRWDKKGGNKTGWWEYQKKNRGSGSKIVRAKVWRGKGKKGLYINTWKYEKERYTALIKIEQLHIIWLRAYVPAEDCPLVFGVHGEPNGLLASPRGHSLCGDCLTGCRLSLALFLIAVWAVGGRAVWCHQWSFSRHTHTPHTRCREWQRRNHLTIFFFTILSLFEHCINGHIHFILLLK